MNKNHCPSCGAIQEAVGERFVIIHEINCSLMAAYYAEWGNSESLDDLSKSDHGP